MSTQQPQARPARVMFITGTNTDVGKTYAVAALAQGLIQAGERVAIIKPLQTGEPSGAGDVYTVEKLLGKPVPHFEFARYPEPLAPNLSARRAGMKQADLGEVAAWINKIVTSGEYTYVLVEGAGGLLVRLADQWTLADLAVELKAPLVVVTSVGLGSLNLAELTVEAATRRGIEVAGVIGGSMPADPDLATRLNIEEFPVVTGVPYLGSIPEGADLSHAAPFPVDALVQ